MYEQTVGLLGADLEVRTFASLSMNCDFEWFCLYFQFVGQGVFEIVLWRGEECDF